MPVRQALHISWRAVLWAVAVLLTLSVLATSALFWRLSQGPLDMGFALPHIETALVARDSDLRYTIKQAELVWVSPDQPLLIRAENVSVRSGTVPFFFAPEVHIDLSLRSLLLGHLGVEAVEMQRISLSLTRSSNGRINISGHQPQDIYGPRRIGVSRDVTLSRIMQSLPNIGRLHIANARIIYNDLIERRIHEFHSADLTIRQSGLIGKKDISGVLVLPYDTDTTSGILVSDFTYNTAQALLDVTTAIDGLNPAYVKQSVLKADEAYPFFDMKLTGQMRLGLGDDFSLQHLGFRGKSDGGAVRWPLAWGKETLALSNLNIDFHSRLNEGQARLAQLSAKLNDQTDITLSADIGLGEGYALDRINAEWEIGNLAQNDIARFWPSHVEKTLVEKWMRQRLGNGSYSSLGGSMTMERKDGELPYPQHLDVRFAFDSMDIDYSAPLIPAENVKGSGHMHGRALDLSVESGTIGGLTVTGGTLAFDDLITTGKGDADINLTMTGPVRDVLDYLSKDPINATNNLPFQADKVGGQATADVRVRFPTVKDILIKDIRVDAGAEITNLHIPDVIRGLPLSGGPYQVSATARHYSLSGKGRLGETPIDLEWEEYFSPQDDVDFLSRIRAKLTANHDIRRRFGSDPYGWFSGPSQVDLTYTESKNGKADQLRLNANMRETTITIPELNVTKPAGQDARLTLKGDINGGDLTAIHDLSLTSDALKLGKGNIRLTPQGRLLHVEFATLQTAKSDATLLAERLNGANSPLKILIRGKKFDAAPFLGGTRKTEDEETETQKPQDDYHIRLEVDRVVTGHDRAINDVTAYLETNSAGHTTRLEMDSYVGNGALQIRYDPAEQPFSLRLKAEDAGAALKAFGLYDYMVEGELLILGKPMRTGAIEDVEGRANITGFSISEAPILAKLFNALSISGLFEMLGNGNNLAFTRLETDFTWQNQPEGGIYTFTNGAVRGNSMGLTFSGSIDQQAGRTDIKGTAVPVSALNTVISKIPLLGDILTGGEGGGLIAATFSLSGPSDDPQASVNPLSVLAPGIIRRILFEHHTDTPPAPSTEEQPKQRAPMN